MENAIGWILAVLLIAAPAAVIYFGIKLYRRTKLKQAQEDAAREERIKEAKESWKKKYDGATHVGKTQYDYITDTKRTTVTERATGQQMSYVHTNDSGPDLLTTMIVADMLFNHKNSSSGTVSWKDDVPTVTTTDDDSRKSSWSSSPSYSDDGPSYSSSSDSGPSSDW